MSFFIFVLAKKNFTVFVPYMKVVQHNGYQKNSVSFFGFKEAKRYANCTKLYNKFINRRLYNCNLNKLEGIQEGLKTFEGLSLKQITFALTDLHAINMIRGCVNHCLHCYANSQPFISRSPFENFKQIMDDILALKKRIGINPVAHRGDKYIDCYFDSDGIDMHLFDKDGNKYDAIELGKIIHKSTGMKAVFDTNGWNRNDIEKQKIAEDYVQKFLDKGNSKHFYQVNISLNPFNPKYVRAIKNGYDPKEYSALIPVGEEFEKEPLSPKLQKAENDYREYVKDEVNLLLTFTPLLLKGKLGTIIRGLDDKFTFMQGFRTVDYVTTLENILQNLRLNYMLDLNGKQKYIKSPKMIDKAINKYIKLFNQNSTFLFSSGRMEKFYKVENNGSLEGINSIDKNRERAENNYLNIKFNKRLSAADILYLKMINSDGKVYLYDNYSIIPTDIQLNTSEKPLKTPFWIKVKDFVLKTNMIDRI